MFNVVDLFQWERFITPSIIRIFYWSAIVLTVMFGLSELAAALGTMAVNPIGGFFAAVASIIAAFMGIIVARIVAEFVLIVFRINEHLGAIRNRDAI